MTARSPIGRLLLDEYVPDDGPLRALVPGRSSPVYEVASRLHQVADELMCGRSDLPDLAAVLLALSEDLAELVGVKSARSHPAHRAFLDRLPYDHERVG